jgi:MFS superfamily sulfate permease-like transporter
MNRKAGMNLIESALELISRRPLWGAPIFLAVVGTVSFVAVNIKRWALGETVTARMMVFDLVAYSVATAIAFGCAYWSHVILRRSERTAHRECGSPPVEVK